MLKGQDIIIALSILVKKNTNWRQIDVASETGISVSEVNTGIKRLITAKLLSPSSKSKNPVVNITSLKEFITHGLKYIFPVERGGLTRGIPTSYAAPVFGGAIVFANHDVPVWPDKEGTELGYAFPPLYPSAIKIKNPELYGLLALIDALREGRARERNIASKLLDEKLNDYKVG